MKKFFVFLFSFIFLFLSFGCSSERKSFLVKNTDDSFDSDGSSSVALCVDSKDVLDRGFNQTIYNATSEYCKKMNVPFSYVKCSASGEDTVSCIETAISGGADIVLLAGSIYAGAILEVAPKYPHVCFIAIDISKNDYLSAADIPSYTYNPDSYSLSDFADLSNVYTITFQEEVAGYLAGYAAVSLGYNSLGFVGSMDTPPIRRFGYGFIQGVNDAALEEGTEAELLYLYVESQEGTEQLRATMDKWFEEGTEIVFSVGGTIYTSIGESAKAYGKKLIGAEVDQSLTWDVLYGNDITITSAAKGLAPAVRNALSIILEKGNWNDLAGKSDRLGLITDSDLSLNYVQLPLDTTQFSASFDETAYAALVRRILSGSVSISDDITLSPENFATDIDLIVLNN